MNITPIWMPTPLEAVIGGERKAIRENAVSAMLGTLSERTQLLVLNELRGTVVNMLKAKLQEDAQLLIKRATITAMLKQRVEQMEVIEVKDSLGWGTW